MTDLISRADAIEAVMKHHDGELNQINYGLTLAKNELQALPSAETPKGDLISRADVLKYPIRLDHYDEVNGSREFVYGVESVIEYVESLPSADTDMSEYCDRLWKIAYERGKAEVKQRNKDAISREGLLKSWEELSPRGRTEFDQVIMTIPALPSADAVQGEWTPCSKKMPKELERVNVTWLNHNPPFYYHRIKDIPLIDTAVYYRGKWYWWDVTVIDVLAEYGEDCNAEQIDKDIEVVAWMPLPTPYKGGEDK